MAVYPGGAPWSGETELATEMGVNDIIGLVNFTAGEFRKQKYSVFNSFFLKTNADRTVNANLTFKDGKKAKFGDDGDLEIYHTDPTSVIKNTKVGGELTLSVTTTGPTEDVLITLKPAGVIDINDSFINKTGNINAGLQFQNNDIARFFDNIEFQGVFLSYDGSSAGLSIDSSNNILASAQVNATGRVKTDSVFRVGTYDGVNKFSPAFTCVSDIRYSGSTLQYEEATLIIRGGIITSVSYLSWQNVPTV